MNKFLNLDAGKTLSAAIPICNILTVQILTVGQSRHQPGTSIIADKELSMRYTTLIY